MLGRDVVTLHARIRERTSANHHVTTSKTAKTVTKSGQNAEMNERLKLGSREGGVNDQKWVKFDVGIIRGRPA